MGEEAYQCCECDGTFDGDWGEGQVHQGLIDDQQAHEWTWEYLGSGPMTSIVNRWHSVTKNSSR